MANEKVRRALMRHIWSLNVHSEEGRWRLDRFGEPWRVENFSDPALAHLGSDLRIVFPEKRRVEELPIWERVQRFRQSIPYLFRQAMMAREKGMSYRDFKVGTALLAFKAHQPHDTTWKVFSGMNTKHAPNMRPTCSEPIAINAAYAEDYSLIIGMVVVGDLREEDIGQLLTLHPCHECRWFMHGHPLIDRHTLVLTAPPDFRYFSYSDRMPDPLRFNSRLRYEVRTVGQLLNYHRTRSGDDFE